MRIERRQDKVSPLVGPLTDVTVENYFSRAMSFVKARGGEGFVISNGQNRYPRTEAQWLAWIDYFDDMQIKAWAVRKFGYASVPCEWPDDFDVSARPSRRNAKLPQDPMATGRIPLVRWRSLTAAIAPRREAEREQPFATPIGQLADAFPDPVVFSDELRASL